MGGARRAVTALLAGFLLAGSTAWAQSPLAGNWNSLRHEDEQDRGPGPDLGDSPGCRSTARRASLPTAGMPRG